MYGFSSHGQGAVAQIVFPTYPSYVTDPSSVHVTTLTAAMPAVAGWSAVAWSGTTFCAISNPYSDVIAVSPDGINWTAATLPMAISWTGIGWTGKYFLAVSSGTTYAATSPDGITWTPLTLLGNANWTLCALGNNGVFCFLAAGNGSAQVTTDHGTTFTGATTPSDNWSSFIFTGKEFWAVALNSSNAMSSPDGLTWTSHTLPVTANWCSIVWDGNVLCAMISGSQTVYTSPDGTVWTPRSIPVAGAWAILTSLGGVLFAFTSSSTVAAESTDSGVTWTQRVVALSFAGTRKFAISTFDRFIVLNSGVTAVDVGGLTRYTANEVSDATVRPAQNVISREPAGNLVSINTTYTALGDLHNRCITNPTGTMIVSATGGGGVQYTTDGYVWVSTSVPTGTWYDIAYGNGVYVSVSSGTRDAMTSPDGINWTLRATALPVAGSWNAVAFCNGMFIATIGIGGQATSTIGATSTDGITWAQMAMPSSAIWQRFAGNGTIITAINDYGTGATSTDGRTWTAWGAYVGTYPSKIVVKDGVFYVTGGSSGTSISRSTDGSTWTVVGTTSGTIMYTGLIYTGSKFWLSGNTAPYVYYSTDGTSWNSMAAAGFAAHFGYIGELASGHTNGSSVGFAVGTSPLPATEASTGIISNQQYAAETEAGAGTEAPSALVMGDKYGSITDPYPHVYGGAIPGTTYQWWALIGGGANFVVLNADALRYSPDGINWTTATLPSNQSWRGGVYGGGKYVIAAATVCMTSPDGINWTTGTVPVNAAWNAMCWTGSIYCAIAYGTAASIVSTDGLNWANYATPRSFYAMAWNGTVFCAVANNSITCGTSPNGINWTDRTMQTSQNWYGIAWNGTIFCAICVGNICSTSPDGVTWTDHAMPWNDAWYSIAATGGIFCASSSTNFATSPDGITWTTISAPVSETWLAIGAGHGRFVSAGQSGSKSAVMVMSPYAEAGSLVTSPPSQITETPSSPAEYWYGGKLANGGIAEIGSGTESSQGVGPVFPNQTEAITLTEGSSGAALAVGLQGEPLTIGESLVGTSQLLAADIGALSAITTDVGGIAYLGVDGGNALTLTGTEAAYKLANAQDDEIGFTISVDTQSVAILIGGSSSEPQTVTEASLAVGVLVAADTANLSNTSLESASSSATGAAADPLTSAENSDRVVGASRDAADSTSLSESSDRGVAATLDTAEPLTSLDISANSATMVGYATEPLFATDASAALGVLLATEYELATISETIVYAWAGPQSYIGDDLAATDATDAPSVTWITSAVWLDTLISAISTEDSNIPVKAASLTETLSAIDTTDFGKLYAVIAADVGAPVDLADASAWYKIDVEALEALTADDMQVTYTFVLSYVDEAGNAITAENAHWLKKQLAIAILRTQEGVVSCLATFSIAPTMVIKEAPLTVSVLKDSAKTVVGMPAEETIIVLKPTSSATIT